MKELNLNEVALVSGGGNAGDRLDRGRTASTSYGGQANGFQPNYAAGKAGANLMNDLTSACGAALVGGITGVAGAALSRSFAQVGLTALGAGAAINSACGNNKSSGTRTPFR